MQHFNFLSSLNRPHLHFIVVVVVVVFPFILVCYDMKYISYVGGFGYLIKQSDVKIANDIITLPEISVAKLYKMPSMEPLCTGLRSCFKTNFKISKAKFFYE